MQLLKQAYFEVWMIQVSSLVSKNDRCIILGESMLFDGRLRDNMEEVELWRHIEDFTTALNDMSLTEMETALFVACTIVNAGMRELSYRIANIAQMTCNGVITKLGTACDIVCLIPCKFKISTSYSLRCFIRYLWCQH